MQIVGSTKVVMGQRGNGICFEPVGIFDGSGLEIPQSHLFFAVSSTMLHDPYSVPFAKAVVQLVVECRAKPSAGRSSQNKSKQAEDKSKEPSLQLLDKVLNLDALV